jgi:predicted secreted protein
MRSVTRQCAVVVLASSLALGFPAPVAAAPTAGAPVSVTRTDACAKLTDAIAFLNGRPASPLRTFLLAVTAKLQANYCS